MSKEPVIIDINDFEPNVWNLCLIDKSPILIWHNCNMVKVKKISWFKFLVEILFK